MLGATFEYADPAVPFIALTRYEYTLGETTVVSAKFTVPGPACAGAVVGRAAKTVQFVPVQRSTTKWVSFVDMSVHDRFT
jgi:hypothetical protein